MDNNGQTTRFCISLQNEKDESMAEFNVGDLIIGLDDKSYNITTSRTICKVVGSVQNEIRVKVIKTNNPMLARNVDARLDYSVSSQFFRKATKKEIDAMPLFKVELVESSVDRYPFWNIYKIYKNGSAGIHAISIGCKAYSLPYLKELRSLLDKGDSRISAYDIAVERSHALAAIKMLESEHLFDDKLWEHPRRRKI